MTITVDYLQTNRKTDTGKTLKPWPVLVDHYRLSLNGHLPALPVYADGQTGSARKEWLVADLRQVVFRQAGHFHNGIAVNAVMQHGTGNFQSGLTLTF